MRASLCAQLKAMEAGRKPRPDDPPPVSTAAPRAPRTDTIDWDAQPLGKVTDRELAERLQVHPGVIIRRRMARGIPALFGYNAARAIDWDAQPLGQVPDKAIADDLKCTREQVRAQRALRGIPSWRKSRSSG